MENKNNSVNGGKEYSKMCDMEMVLFNLSQDVERAECVLQDVSEDYFRKIDPNNPDDLWKLKAGHHEYATRTDIAYDYLHKMELDINAAMKVIRGEIDDLKAKRAAVAV